MCASFNVHDRIAQLYLYSLERNGLTHGAKKKVFTDMAGAFLWKLGG